MNESRLDILTSNGPTWFKQSDSDPMMNGVSATTAIWAPFIVTSAQLKYVYACRLLVSNGALYLENARSAVANLIQGLSDFVKKLENPNAYFSGNSLGAIMIAAMARTTAGRKEHNVLNNLIYGHG